MTDPSIPPAAPASNATLDAAPAMIIDGEWDDAEWRATAASRGGPMTAEQQYLYAGGPRPHPWGRAAHAAVLKDGRTAYFPSKAAYAAWRKAGGEAEANSDAAPALDKIARALAQGGRSDAAGPDPGLADEKLQAASPNGTVAG